MWKKVGQFLSEYLIGYGERPLRMFWWIVGAIFFFACFYFFFDIIQSNGVSTQFSLNSLYFSAVTFATLGYGDFAPVTTCGKILATSQAIIGVIFIALFVVSLARKIIRD